MIPTPAQDQILRDTHRYRVLCCGRRFGKTALAVEEIKGFAIYRTARIAYLATTYQQAHDIAWERLVEELSPIVINANKSRLDLRVRNNKGKESIIMLRGWEAVETLRGQQFDFLVMDEVASMRSFESHWQKVLRPTLTDTRGQVLFLSTPQGFNHFYDLYNQEQKDKDFKSFHFTTYDNPHIPSDEIEKAKQELTEDAFAQEYLADFRKYTGLIYKEFDRDVHIIPPSDLPLEWRRYRAMDFGAVNPTVCLWIAVDNYDRVYVYDEYRRAGEATSFHANVILAKTGTTPIIATYGDPSGEQQQLDYAQHGVLITPATKIYTHKEDWVNVGIKRVQELLDYQNQQHKPRLYVMNNCRETIKEFESYHWLDKKSSGVQKDMPEKVDDHCMDALRYFAVSYEPTPLYDTAREDIELIINASKITGY